MELKLQKFSEGLSKPLLAFQPDSTTVEKFKLDLRTYFHAIDGDAREENLKFHLMKFLNLIFAPVHTVEQHESIDFVIRSGGRKTKPAVLFEIKREKNSTDMIQHGDINRKAFHEVVLYYMRERLNGNTDIRKIVIGTEYDLYVFDATEFENLFWRNRHFQNEFNAWRRRLKVNKTTEFFYSEITAKFMQSIEASIGAIHIDLKQFKNKLDDSRDIEEIIILYKLLSPYHLLKLELANDSNVLNQAFYDELLHIIGLEENKSKHVITRVAKDRRNQGTLLENTITHIQSLPAIDNERIIEIYGASKEDREFNIALELCLTWINRILFLKLLEAQLLRYNDNNQEYKFLNLKLVKDFSDLSSLFFLVLAKRPDDRNPADSKKFNKVPFLNSALFERTELENLFSVTLLSNNLEMPIFKSTVLKDQNSQKSIGSLRTLEYVFNFLDAFDFGSTGNGTIREENQTIINASVLGLIFEKINGYKDGAIFTPGYITMYMARRVIEKTVIETFQREIPNWTINDLDDLRNCIDDRSKSSILKMNQVIDNLKICDPAVGSGHFLVSCLNELIALKSRLGILADNKGRRLLDYHVEVENDELTILHSTKNETFSYKVENGKVPEKVQAVQELLFHEKQKLIENCLFGVDINANSVRICQLRLWIELLKCAYYRNGGVDELETLPSIDINIKCGNSLLSKYTLDESLSSAFKGAGLKVNEYKSLVREYKRTNNMETKRQVQVKLAKLKSIFQKTQLDQIETDIKTQSKELDEIQSQYTISGLEEVTEKKLQKKSEELRNSIKNKNIKKEKLQRLKTFLFAFEWRYEFPEILDDKGQFVGFDIIITNPPYMRIQEIDAIHHDQKEFYRQNFPRTAVGSFDMANLFFELALELSKPNGNNIFIFPHKVFNSKNGSHLRNFLLNERSVKQITHFGVNQIFESATTYSCITLFNKQRSDSFKFKRFEPDEEIKNSIWKDELYSDIKYDWIEDAASKYGSNLWIFFNDPRGYKLFNKCYNSSSIIGERFEDLFQGIATSKDALYICRKLNETKDKFEILVNPEEKSENPHIETKKFLVEKEFFKPLLMGKDVHRYGTLDTDRLVFFPYQVKNNFELVQSKFLAKNYPLTSSFVNHYAKNFKSRENNQGMELDEWYAYIYPKNLTKFESKKLVTMNISTNHPNFALDLNSTYHNTKVYGLILKEGVQEGYKFFLGVLNSKLFWWFLVNTGDSLSGNARTVSKSYMFPFPIPRNITKTNEHKIIRLVEKLLSSKANGGSEQNNLVLEDEINNAVYNLYDLDDDEVEIIELACS